MTKRSRYSTENFEAENGILKNKLDITDPQGLSDAETLYLKKAYQHYLTQLNAQGFLFNLKTIFDIHDYFLGPIYHWAGKVRTVNISKDSVMFATAEFLDENLKQFDQFLSRELVDLNKNKEELAGLLSTIHNDFNVIHPFREGNGRTIRLFIDLIAVSQGYDLIDYEYSGKEAYFKACAEGIHGDNEPMRQVIFNGLFIL